MFMGTTTDTKPGASLSSVTLEVADVEEARRFYSAFGVDAYIRLRACEEADGAGFRGFTLALTVSGPATVDGFVATAVAAGATVLKPATKSLWGYGGVVRAPDGAIWKIATSARKDTGHVTRTVDEVVLLLGVQDVKATRQFYVDRGLTVGKSFGGKYAEFLPADSDPVKLALYKRRALAKDLGVPDDTTTFHGIVLGSANGAFTDPDGFTWEPTAPADAARS
ncbi:glyoxalase [Streptomyces sp. NBC_00102]|uniref:glyoxalase n=1 Tax=Streptomyces sp. NBC_00102 TaxID=2975652 RepID=UPI00224FD150|nr:glyoxalase [Streptomyces sp. NBC_00102]MCX5400966.1 glyoxalase [Streptomyces sp. NBC_00102]